MNGDASRLLLAGLLLLAASGSPAALAPGVELPPLTTPASRERHAGKFIWADLVTPDLSQAEQFYGGLFGWTFVPAVGDANVAVVWLHGRPIAGMVQRPLRPDGERRPAWLTFFSTRDVAAARTKAASQGARLLSPSRLYRERGRQAVFADPEGAVFAVLDSSSGDPADITPEPGYWIWSSLLVEQPDKEAAFYRALFGYEVFDLAAEADTTPAEDSSQPRHLILAREQFARAGVSSLPHDSRPRHAHWLDFVRVEDAAAAASKAVELGGRVLVEPRVDRQGGHLAVVADPFGAAVGLMEWSETTQEPP